LSPAFVFCQTLGNVESLLLETGFCKITGSPGISFPRFRARESRVWSFDCRARMPRIPIPALWVRESTILFIASRARNPAILIPGLWARQSRVLSLASRARIPIPGLWARESRGAVRQPTLGSRSQGSGRGNQGTFTILMSHRSSLVYLLQREPDSSN
jgi:hypothetical protein